MIGRCRETLKVDRDGELTLVKEVGEETTVRPLGPIEKGEFRVPEHLMERYRELLDEWLDGARAERDYRAEAEYLWNRR